MCILSGESVVNVLDDILDGHTGEDELADEIDEVQEKKSRWILKYLA